MPFFYLFMYKKNPKNQQTKRRRVWQYLFTTGMPQPPIDPPPLALAHHANFVASTACPPTTAALSAKRGNSSLKDKHPKQTRTTEGYFKKLGTPRGHQCNPAREKNFEGMAKKRYKSKMHKKLGTSLTHLLERAKLVKIQLQSAFSYSPTAVMIKAKHSPLWIPCAVEQIIILWKYFYYQHKVKPFHNWRRKRSYSLNISISLRSQKNPNIQTDKIQTKKPVSVIHQMIVRITANA